MAWPRRSRAFPPSAVTTSTYSIPKRRDQDCLDRVQAILRLLEGDIRLRFEDVVGDLEAVGHAMVLRDLLADRRFGVMICGEAVHEPHMRIPACLHQLLVDLVRR